LAVFITVLDVFLLLLLTRIGFRKIEALVICLILVILAIFAYQVALSNPDWKGIIEGFIPNNRTFASSPTVAGMSPLTGALGIIGATVMPHNLYLHSSISQSRKINHQDKSDVARAVRFSTWDSNIQLTVAFVVNSLLLIMGVAVFKTGVIDDPSFFGLYDALSNPSVLSNGLLADVAKTGALSTLFAVALLASGQNSTITGTLTGQVIMEGFIHMRMPMWARRLVTRLLSVVPVLICVSMTRGQTLKAQHEAINNLMNNSQVFLAFALPFSIIPLLMLTNSKEEMGDFKNNLIIKFLGWISVIALTYLNLIGLPNQIDSFLPNNLNLSHFIAGLLIVGVILLLIWTILELYRGNKKLYLK
ncbi:MAG: Nramp family divalent metal transporter, partial [Lactococcus lactis]|nr:Nramp family divalent metal transporter [Lactococcus lactis]